MRGNTSPMSGVLLFDKPSDMSSHRAVAIVRRLGNCKAGHAGTLDPMATGLLPILIGSATKLSTMLITGDKEYIATMLLGCETDTLDTTGTVLAQSPVNVTLPQLEAAVLSFSGAISQVPPMYSAISIDGQRMYKLARMGLEVDRPSRLVTIYKIELISFDGREAVISVACSKGTYIRSLIADIGLKLGCGACMSALRRTTSAGFSIDDAHTVQSLERDGVLPHVISSEQLFHTLPILNPPDFYLRLLQNGQRVDAHKLGARADAYRLYAEAGFIGLLERSDEKYGLIWRL